ncbi:hypothetical protein [Parachitinimonas caeni]|uniref:3-oxoacyl-[acyl-carrier-protein] synthase-1 n=1 Tax=Parachitinimonas caeni TaxID=3031301 RepID=A0ABT7E2G9_9NEIS|nr:hypothetical protein [Parachitinimonas caeni]MDK2126511.1 hypothetical protein [Parachitinimonas caeni]
MNNAQPLILYAAGACCSLGYQLAAAECAIRAGMDHFENSEFRDNSGKPLKVARLPMGNVWGEERLAQLAVAAVKDCITRSGITLHANETVLLLAAAERDRPHTEVERYQACFDAIEATLGVKFHAHSRIIPYGRAALAPALMAASESLRTDRAVKQVLLVGADSYLNAATINYLLATQRVLESDNARGFIPGEAAAALLLRRHDPADSRPALLRLSGLGVTREEGKPDGEVPTRAQALSSAIRTAMQQAELTAAELDFRLCEHNGDPFYAHEAAIAHARLGADGCGDLAMLTLGEYVGEVGAAIGPLALAYLSIVCQRPDGPGPVGLIHLGNDDGARSALIAERP